MNRHGSQSAAGSVRLAVWITFALCVSWGHSSVAQESTPAQPASAASNVESADRTTEQKLARANALLGSQDDYPEAIQLYREVLREEPSQREARLRLAQVLSWSGDLEPALVEYAELTRRHPGDLEIMVQHAEVLSWSGATQRSLELFERILERDPTNARAARGVARSLLWSGHRPAADRAYARALELQEDAEARQEWSELRRALRPRLDVEIDGFSDSSKFDRRAAFVQYSGFQDAATRIGVRLGWVRISHPQDDVAASVRSAHDDDRGLDVGLVLNRELDSGPKLTVELGTRSWAEAGLAPYARLHAQHTLESIGSLGLHLVHEGYGDVSNSFEAVQEDVSQTALAGTLYRQLSARLGAFGRLEVASIDDGNSRQSFYGSLGFRPWSQRDAEVSLGSSFQRFSDDSDSYYAPEQDAGLDVGWSHRIPLGSAWSFGYQGALGFQSTKERGISESGTLWNARSELVWKREPWSVRLHFGVSYSQRSSRYNTRTGGLEVAREF